MFSSSSFIISGLTFRSFNPFLAYFCMWCKKEFTFCSFIVDQYFQHLLLKNLSFSYCTFSPPSLLINWLYMHGFISDLSILFPLSLCLVLCQYNTFFDYYSFVPVWFLLCSFFPKIALAIQGVLWFQINLRVICFRSIKHVLCTLI